MSRSHVEDYRLTLRALRSYFTRRFSAVCSGDPFLSRGVRWDYATKAWGKYSQPPKSSYWENSKLSPACRFPSHAVFLDRPGKEWREEQIKNISDKVFDRLKEETGKTSLTFEDIYIATLGVYNDINKRLPGPHIDPPSKEVVKALIEELDLNLDGRLDREEFAEFIRTMTKDTLTLVGKNLLIALVVAPAVALFTKKATEGVPGVGAVVQRIPNSLYASVVALAAVLVQNSAATGSQ